MITGGAKFQVDVEEGEGVRVFCPKRPVDVKRRTSEFIDGS